MVYADLDRLFFEYLRLALVAADLLPDQLLYTTDAAYEAARQAMLTANGTLVDIYGQGTIDAKGPIESERIVIHRRDTHHGSIGLSPSTYYVPNGNGTFNKYLQPDMTKNVEYEIRYMAKSVETERTLATIMDNVLGQRRYLLTIGSNGLPTTEYALIVFESSNNASSRGDFLEYAYRYRAVDVSLATDVLIRENIPQLTSVTYSLYLTPTPVSPLPTADEVVTINQNS